MKNSIALFAVLVLGALIIGLLFIFQKEEDIPVFNGMDEPIVIQKFKEHCDSAIFSHWNAKALRENLNLLENYKNNKLITENQYLNLEELLYTSYYNQLNQCFTHSLKFCSPDSLQNIKIECTRLKTNNYIADNTKSMISAINAHSFFLELKRKYYGQITIPYDSLRIEKSLTRLKTLPLILNDCPSFRIEKEKQITRLTNYNETYMSFNLAKKNFYDIGPEFYGKRDGAIRMLYKLRLRAVTENYSYLEEEINELLSKIHSKK